MFDVVVVKLEDVVELAQKLKKSSHFSKAGLAEHIARSVNRNLGIDSVPTGLVMDAMDAWVKAHLDTES